MWERALVMVVVIVLVIVYSYGVKGMTCSEGDGIGRRK